MKNLSAAITLAITLGATTEAFAQPDRDAFVVAPYMQRAWQAEERGDWAEVRRQTEQALRRVSEHVEARQLFIEALIELQEFPLAETEARLLPEAQRQQALLQVRERWIVSAEPELSAIVAWRSDMTEAAWIQMVQTHLFNVSERDGQQAAFNRALGLMDMTSDAQLARLAANLQPETLDAERERNLLLQLLTGDLLEPGEAERLALMMADQAQLDDVMPLLQRSQASWHTPFVEALLGRLIFLERYEQAKQVILASWSLDTIPESQRNQLVELAILTNDTALMARSDLRDEQYCMDSVAWIGERDPDMAGDVLTRCDQTLDNERWQYLASLYNPGLLPPPPAADSSAPSGAQTAPQQAAAQRAAEERLRQQEAEQLLAQRRQDALDDAYRGNCNLSVDSDFDAIRDEVTAICLRESMPGAASVYFEQVLSDRYNPRRQQLLREAAYNAYQAADYDQAMVYWEQVNASLTPDEQNAVAATRAAQLAAAAPEQNPDTIQPRFNLDELRLQAQAEPQLYGLELGLRLSGHEDAEVRAESVPWLESARLRDPYDFRIPETLTYRYHELADPGPAIINAERAIDGMDSALAVGGVHAPQLDEREFSLRRTHQYLTQRNRIYVGGAWSRFGVLDAIGATPRNSTFQIASFEHLLGEYPDRGGRQLGVYGRVLGSGTDNRRYFEDPAWGLGLRWKPWGSQNINLFAEIFEPAHGDTDLLLRASASLLDGGDLRDDWRPREDGWHWQSLYLDAAWFAIAENYQLYASYSRGYDFKLSSREHHPRPHTLAPYFTVWSGHSRDFSDTAAGLGLRYRHWFRQDVYNAWRNRIDVRLEMYRSVAGDRKNTNGWRLQTEWML